MPSSGLCNTNGSSPSGDDGLLCPYDVNLDGDFNSSDLPHFICVLLNSPNECLDACGFPSTTAESGGEQMAMGGGGESMMDGSPPGAAVPQEGSSWEPWFTWEQLSNFAQWFKAHPRSAHPEMTDEQYYRIWKQAMKDNGLWRV